MTDFVPPSAPKSTLPRFGTSIVGKEFEWDAVSEDGSAVEVVKARAAASISFEDTLRYTTGRHAQLVQTQTSAKIMRTELEKLDVSSDDYATKFNELVDQRLAFERDTWTAAIDILLILVNETDRAPLRPALLRGDPKQINDLRDWLEHETIASNVQDAAVASQVDPTLPKQPEPSVSDPDSGPDFESKESSSTD